MEHEDDLETYALLRRNARNCRLCKNERNRKSYHRTRGL